MSLTASICITFAGIEPLGDTLYLFSNYDNFTTSFGSVLTDDISENNCPYIISGIPEGTSSIEFRDPVSLCCFTMLLENNNLCVNCNLHFDVYETETISQLIVGNLVGDCDDNISDYIINWYRTGSSEVVLTTGYGTQFSNIGWQLNHPLTGNQSPIFEPGTYYPVISIVNINGIIYSNSDLSGALPANLNCFQNQKITVNAAQCSQGNNIGDYSHHYQFDNYSVGAPPISLSTNLEISNTTNYIAYQFRAFEVFDTLRMTFYGSAYNNLPLIIENVKVSMDISQDDVRPTTFLKSVSSFTGQPIKKVVCLTGLTINEGDYVKITVTPNQTIENTLWDLYFTCLNSFSCVTCFDNFQNSSPKIDLSSLEVTELSCDRVSINFDFSGCTFDEFAITDIGKYFMYTYPNTTFNFLSSFFTGQLYFTNQVCNTPICNLFQPYLCGPDGGTYTFTKSIVNGQGLISFSFNNFNDFIFYYNSYLSVYSCLSGGSSNDNTNINFYREFDLTVPNPQNPQEQCGDTTDKINYNIHHTSVVTTGGTGPYTLTVTMPTITKGLFPTNCQLSCEENINYMVNEINYNSLTQSNNISFTTNVGSKLQIPFNTGRKITLENYFNTQVEYGSSLDNWQFQNETYVYSGNGVLIQSLTGQTCQNIGKFRPFYNYGVTGNGGYSYAKEIGYWTLQLINESNVLDFKVMAKPTVNWVSTLPSVTAFTYINGSITYSNPDYTF